MRLATFVHFTQEYFTFHIMLMINRHWDSLRCVLCAQCALCQRDCCPSNVWREVGKIRNENNLHASERVIGADLSIVRFAITKNSHNWSCVRDARMLKRGRTRSARAHKLNFSNNFLNRNIFTHWNVRHARFTCIHARNRRITIDIGSVAKNGWEKFASHQKSEPFSLSLLFHIYLSIKCELIFNYKRAPSKRTIHARFGCAVCRWIRASLVSTFRQNKIETKTWTLVSDVCPLIRVLARWLAKWSSREVTTSWYGTMELYLCIIWVVIVVFLRLVDSPENHSNEMMTKAAAAATVAHNILIQWECI